MRKSLLFFVALIFIFSCQKKELIEYQFEVKNITPSPSVKKVGLALGGGGARGFAEIGVLRVLEQEKIPLSCVAGTSVGSLIGALYCDNGRVVDVEYHSLAIEKDDIFDFNIFSVFQGGLIKGDKLEKFLEMNLTHKRIEEMKVPLIVVTTDLMTGESIGFESGDVVKAVHASCAIPGLFVPVKINGKLYVDGGVSNPVPVSFLRKRGMDLIIAVSIPPEIPYEIPSKTTDIIRYSLAIMENKISEAMIREADVVIKPKCGDVRFNDFSRRRELILEGERATREVLPVIRELLER